MDRPTVESSCGDDGIKDGLTTAEQDELVKLRGRAQRLGHENEILGRGDLYRVNLNSVGWRRTAQTRRLRRTQANGSLTHSFWSISWPDLVTAAL